MTREEAIGYLKGADVTVGRKSKTKTAEVLEIAIKALEQEPKTGHWIWQTEDIYRCSECGNDIRVKEVMNIPQYVRCPICEAKMVEPQESEEKE